MVHITLNLYAGIWGILLSLERDVPGRPNFGLAIDWKVTRWQFGIDRSTEGAVLLCAGLLNFFVAHDGNFSRWKTVKSAK